MNSIILNEPAETYYKRHLDECNSTGIKELAGKGGCAARFAYWVSQSEIENAIETPTQTFGKAFHCWALEPDVFERAYVVLPKDAPSRPTEAMLNAKAPSPESRQRQDWWATWGAETNGKILLKQDDFDRARRMGDSLRANPVCAGLVAGGDRELTYRWTDTETGLRCKARIDNRIAGEFMIDLKSCADASPEGFAKAVAIYYYDVQMAHYLAGAKECGDPLKSYIILAVENTPPFVCQPHIINPMGEERGWTIRAKAMALQARCLAENRWPGYSDSINELALPNWAYFNIEEN